MKPRWMTYQIHEGWTKHLHRLASISHRFIRLSLSLWPQFCSNSHKSCNKSAFIPMDDDFDTHSAAWVAARTFIASRLTFINSHRSAV